MHRVEQVSVLARHLPLKVEMLSGLDIKDPAIFLLRSLGHKVAEFDADVIVLLITTFQAFLISLYKIR